MLYRVERKNGEKVNLYLNQKNLAEAHKCCSDPKLTCKGACVLSGVVDCCDTLHKATAEFLATIVDY